MREKALEILNFNRRNLFTVLARRILEEEEEVYVCVSIVSPVVYILARVCIYTPIHLVCSGLFSFAFISVYVCVYTEPNYSTAVLDVYLQSCCFSVCGSK